MTAFVVAACISMSVTALFIWIVHPMFDFLIGLRAIDRMANNAVYQIKRYDINIDTAIMLQMTKNKLPLTYRSREYWESVIRSKVEDALKED